MTGVHGHGDTYQHVLVVGNEAHTDQGARGNIYRQEVSKGYVCS